MALNLKDDAVFSTAVDGLPRVVELINTLSREKRLLALAAARQSYLQTAQAVGYGESDAKQWASTVISLLEIASLASERAAQSGLLQPKSSALDQAEQSLDSDDFHRAQVAAD